MLKPIKNNLLVKLAPKTDSTKSGLILARETRELWAEIVDVGSTVNTEDFNIGTKVFIELGKFKVVKIEDGETGRDYAIIKEEDIIGILED